MQSNTSILQSVAWCAACANAQEGSAPTEKMVQGGAMGPQKGVSAKRCRWGAGQRRIGPKRSKGEEESRGRFWRRKSRAEEYMRRSQAWRDWRWKLSWEREKRGRREDLKALLLTSEEASEGWDRSREAQGSTMKRKMRRESDGEMIFMMD